jgi:hypothetical protein
LEEIGVSPLVDPVKFIFKHKTKTKMANNANELAVGESIEITGRELIKFDLIARKKKNLTAATLAKYPDRADEENLTLTYLGGMINISSLDKAAKYFTDDTLMADLYSVNLTRIADYDNKRMYTLSGPVTRNQAKGYLENEFEFAVLEGKIESVKSGTYRAKDIVMTDAELAIQEAAAAAI